MTDEERELLVGLIEKELVKLNKKANDLKEFTAPISPDDSIGRVSRMDAMQ